MQIGEIVYSIRGRDAERYFVVIDIYERFVYICDGKVRLLEKPKRKNIAHIKSTNQIDYIIKKKLQQKVLNNRELRDILRDFGINKPSFESKEV